MGGLQLVFNVLPLNIILESLEKEKRKNTASYPDHPKYLGFQIFRL